MGSGSKYFKSREYQERAQPEAREHLGELQKRTGYLKRAKKQKDTQKQLDLLRDKAFFKNQDEFRFNMHTQNKTKEQREDGVEKKLTKEERRLANTQDANYVNSKISSERSKIQRLENEATNLSEIGWNPRNKHTIFVDTKDEVETFSPVEYFQTVPEALGRAYNRPKISTLQSADLLRNKKADELMDERNHILFARTVRKERKKTQNELDARKKRLDQIQHVQKVLQHRKDSRDTTNKTKERRLRVKEEGEDPDNILGDYEDDDDVEKSGSENELSDEERIPVYKWDRVRKR